MIEKLLNKTTIRLIDLISQEPSHIRDAAEKLNASPGHIASIVKFLKRNGILKDRREKNRRVISLNDRNIYVSRIRSLINLEKISRNNNFRQLLRLGAVGIYGSYACGKDDRLSDIDIWVYTRKASADIQKITTKLMKSMGKRVNFLVLDRAKLESLKKNDYEFYSRLKLTSIIFGDDVFD